MILTPIPHEQLDAALDRFAGQLDEPAARAAFARIRATVAERARGAAAETHRLEALALARRCGMAIHPAGARSAFNWDGAALDGATEAYVILPDTAERAAAERAAILPIPERDADEAVASLLGILWEAALGQPALASFLDQNWLEGLDRSAAPHFTAVLRRLRRLGVVETALPNSGECQAPMREMR